MTLTDSEITENTANPASVGKELTRVPRIMVNLGGDFEKGPFTFSLVGRYRGKQYTTDTNTDTSSNVYGVYDDYFTSDAKAAFKLTSKAKIAFSVTNLLDREYYSCSLAPGRCWFTELALTF